MILAASSRFRTVKSGWTFSSSGSAPSGLSLSPDGEWLYVALNTRHALAIVNTQSRAVKEVAVGSYPYTTAVTKDGALSAHFEHTVVVTDTGCRILTLPEGVHERAAVAAS